MSGSGSIRVRLKAEHKPAHEDLARAALNYQLTSNRGREGDERLMDMLDEVVDSLKAIGFSCKQIEEVWFDLQDRYDRGWSMLRQRRSIAQIEADGFGEPLS